MLNISSHKENSKVQIFLGGKNKSSSSKCIHVLSHHKQLPQPWSPTILTVVESPAQDRAGSHN